MFREKVLSQIQNVTNKSFVSNTKRFFKSFVLNAKCFAKSLNIPVDDNVVSKSLTYQLKNIIQKTVRKSRHYNSLLYIQCGVMMTAFLLNMLQP